jgi:UDP-N-acetylglucosamine--N-acetylmuramyl-(pentapeptide) pyrophosphoryl-undecaprenol N-acetylglucosamine transferase
MSRAGQSVLIMAGGTGGHIFPGLAVADSLRSRGVEVRWLGARGGMECQKVPSWDIPLDVVDISALRGKGLARWLQAPWRLLRAVIQAAGLIADRRPACAISFGGYAAGPGGLAAKLRGVPLLVHEQNRVPGMTNRVLSRFAARVLQAFPGTWEERLSPVTCGNPVRQDLTALEAPASRLAGRGERIRLLVTGGSQGSRALNALVPAALSLGPAGRQIDVRHQCGRGWLEETTAAYRAAGLGAEVSEFIDDMAAAYGWADAVVCRAGALTVSEVAAVGLAALFVPYPHAVDDHQTRNAEYLVERGAALLLSETGLSAEQLAAGLDDLLADRNRLIDMAQRARAAAVPDSATRVAQICQEFIAS